MAGEVADLGAEWATWEESEVEPIRGRWPINLTERRLAPGGPGGSAVIEDREASRLPTYAMVRASHDTYRVEYTPTQAMVVAPLPFTEAQAALERLREWMGLLEEVTA
jgi:hypothetical protein